MNKLARSRIMSLLAFSIIFIIIWTLLNFSFENLHGAYKAMISGGLAAFLALKVQSFKT